MNDADPRHSPEEKVENSLPAPLIAAASEHTEMAQCHAPGGCGLVAEDASHQNDVLRGQRAEDVETSNQCNEADRIVSGVLVQSKYCQTAAESIGAAFDPATGNYRYVGQKLEVPKDQYAACVELMRQQIARGRVAGVDSVADAESIVHQGTVTYRQARNVARAGILDSLVFDAKSQAVTSTYAFAISFAVVYAHSCWKGETQRNASRSAIATALIAGSTTLITDVLTAQVLRTRGAAIGTIAVQNGVNAASSTALGQEIIHHIAAGSLGQAVSGAAAVEHVSMLLRSNTIAAVIATTVTCTPDFYRAAFDRSISWRQFTKNISLNAISIAGGSIGWIGGTAAGATIGTAIPGIGTAIGGIIGGIIGAVGISIGTSAAAKAIADKITEDDSTRLSLILQDEIRTLASDYMLNENETEKIAVIVNETATPNWFRRMFKAAKQAGDESALREFVRAELEPHFEGLIQSRPKLALPSAEELDLELSLFVEDLLAEAG